MKTIIVLANSIKHHPGRCIAGREIAARGGQYVLGAWIRPVSGHGEGELDPSETACADGSQIAVGDIARVALERARNDLIQRENWLIAGQRPWTRVMARQLSAVAAVMEERPADLWLEPGPETDRISHRVLERFPPQRSICVIRPTDLRLVFWTERNPYKPGEKRKNRARFGYNGAQYDLSLTDPVANRVYCSRWPQIGEKPLVVPLNGPAAPLICVSLAPMFEGCHYKVLATVLGR